MATGLIMPWAPGSQHPQLQQHDPRLYHHQHRQQPSRPQQAAIHLASDFSNMIPTSSGDGVSPLTSSSNGSNSNASWPSATTTNFFVHRQQRPLYRPAVLRPNRFPAKINTSQPPSPGAPRPMRGDRQPGSSPEDETVDDRLLSPAAGERSTLRLSGGLIGSFGGALGRLSRRGSIASTNTDTTSMASLMAGSQWNLQDFPGVTGSPTRKHWKPDHDSSVCDHATCKRTFNYFVRRHHCRVCGHIFCDAHSVWDIPLDQDAKFNPRGVPSRACDHCHAQFIEWSGRACNGAALPPPPSFSFSPPPSSSSSSSPSTTPATITPTSAPTVAASSSTKPPSLSSSDVSVSPASSSSLGSAAVRPLVTYAARAASSGNAMSGNASTAPRAVSPKNQAFLNVPPAPTMAMTPSSPKNWTWSTF